ncbi:hypothetical protein [Tritonibacter mobilis]|uniref:Uncharacterized protein n=1 Tax=Tritonibacter scottomollicae TaxID=483013 RepID=A0A2T1A2T5_TRISK|nr:hypothetical protein [Tritonibacter mobilis]PRZ42903.1 hypothetical protein CLV89_1312 [Tritonibacter scottomollicae]
MARDRYRHAQSPTPHDRRHRDKRNAPTTGRDPDKSKLYSFLRALARAEAERDHNMDIQ